MKLTLNEWIEMQKRPVRVCSGPEDMIPKAIFIGVLAEDGSVETHMKLLSVAKWRELQEVWEGVLGVNHPDYNGNLPHQAPQFFLICN